MRENYTIKFINISFLQSLNETFFTFLQFSSYLRLPAKLRDLVKTKLQSKQTNVFS